MFLGNIYWSWCFFATIFAIANVIEANKDNYLQLGRQARFFKQHGLGLAEHRMCLCYDKKGIATFDNIATNLLAQKECNNTLYILQKRPSNDPQIVSAISLAKQELERLQNERKAWDNEERKQIKQAREAKNKQAHLERMTREEREDMLIREQQQALAARLHARAEVQEALTK